MTPTRFTRSSPDSGRRRTDRCSTGSGSTGTRGFSPAVERLRREWKSAAGKMALLRLLVAVVVRELEPRPHDPCGEVRLDSPRGASATSGSAEHRDGGE